jgi:hypothetical protein
MYHMIFTGHQLQYVPRERELAARIAHLRAAGERCARRGFLRRCAPATAPQAAR